MLTEGIVDLGQASAAHMIGSVWRKRICHHPRFVLTLEIRSLVASTKPLLNDFANLGFTYPTELHLFFLLCRARTISFSLATEGIVR